jgi:hypothetical protein
MKTIVLSILTLFVAGVLLTSCDDKIEVLQAYDFNLTTMPVQKQIKQGETAEIRCQLNKSGNYEGVKFYIRYFQPDGKGTLKMDDGTVFLPNDSYELDRETFRLYYTSECTDQQTIDVVVYDNFGQSYELSFSWQNDSDN